MSHEIICFYIIIQFSYYSWPCWKIFIFVRWKFAMSVREKIKRMGNSLELISSEVLLGLERFSTSDVKEIADKYSMSNECQMNRKSAIILQFNNGSAFVWTNWFSCWRRGEGGGEGTSHPRDPSLLFYFLIFMICSTAVGSKTTIPLIFSFSPQDSCCRVIFLSFFGLESFLTCSNPWPLYYLSPFCQPYSTDSYTPCATPENFNII